MKTILHILILSGITLATVSCASDYVISTNDGHMITAHGKPAKDEDTGLISYKDLNGDIHQVHQKDVKEIVEK